MLCYLSLLCHIHKLGFYLNVLPIDVFPTPVRPVWCVQEVRSVRSVVITHQIGLCFASYPLSFSCVLTPVICITNTCMAPSHLFAPHKLRDIGKFHVSY
jgi:hypothetical protein